MPGHHRLDLAFLTPGCIESRAILRSSRKIAPRFKRSRGERIPASSPGATLYSIATSLNLELWLTEEVIEELYVLLLIQGMSIDKYGPSPGQ